MSAAALSRRHNVDHVINRACHTRPRACDGCAAHAATCTCYSTRARPRGIRRPTVGTRAYWMLPNADACAVNGCRQCWPAIMRTRRRCAASLLAPAATAAASLSLHTPTKNAQDDFSSPRLGMLSECQFRVKMHINPRTWTPLFAHFRFSRPPRLTLDGFQGPTSALTGPNVRRGGEGGGRGRDPGIFCQIRVRGLSHK